MKEDTARQLANVVLGAAALGAAVLIARTPALRRIAIGLAVSAVTTSLPLWVSGEVQRAWIESGRRTA